MYPGININEQQHAPPRGEEKQTGHISELVFLGNSRIANFHDFQYANSQDLVDEILGFRTIFENIYLNTNLHILKNHPGLEFETKKDKIIVFTDLCGDIENWVSYQDWQEDIVDTFVDGALLFKLYTQALIEADLYDPTVI
jgi:hypothetical protein